MIFENPVNEYMRYTDIIHRAFEFYRIKIRSEIKYEQQNNNNFVLIDFFQRIDKSLNDTKEYYISNIKNIIESTENHKKYRNIGIFKSVLFVYSNDLNRCLDILKNNYSLYPLGEGSIKEKSEIVRELLLKVNAL